MLFSLFFWLFSAAFLLPFGVAVSYFIMGLNMFVKGKKEESAFKIRSGYISMLNSFIAMIALAIVWRWLAEIIFSWDW